VAIFIGVAISIGQFLLKASRPFLAEYEFNQVGELRERRDASEHSIPAILARGDQDGANGIALEFNPSSSLHSDRHPSSPRLRRTGAADKWARQGRHALPFQGIQLARHYDYFEVKR
jgi:hypothetical protein